ncbi:D-alanyl-D-alanine carboxypeptidase/D-alanyl-D-alanine-endopeptidase (penicillin-binding protein 4) [Microbacterium endophyticum]|uniref:D-alanyl-D-alanine carboxypeptidase/D-alanyl-D-alanine-endopeptidase (Penicillin-binding protein 4) n=1 Tax=Microbacterium endophyticum TaxID=1526412 RepID=A0A7W4V3G3_9MICO|nr:D-alanyl-D-alanine carboxypeptidase/D-alanyl-D-alanine-endopeptidase [Microbacterium endophyticum]MBB2976187.1 D-alanyl-D-alanine carboxypeptidase/D-alanyl-D-alanine-endopeptidase (penicillin-binding protein 4) [Microbacterium endophyticum]NIK36484.1 D-alanyl-D-alanine carboxypeptidase/D-alanyl-D-alanine-endopeptidase (penicillin-binding protein 4) [Microbacterium endophyticum]
MRRNAAAPPLPRFSPAIALLLSAVMLAGCTGSDDGELQSAIEDVTEDPMFAGGGWGILAVDIETGETVYELNSTVPFVPGSIQKSFTTAAALDLLGENSVVTTPVYATGSVVEGALKGDLVLAGRGDFSFGLRDLSDGTLEITSFDHNEANSGLLPVELNSGDPLSALRSLAGDLRDSGVTSVSGNVYVDNQYFNTMNEWPDDRIDSIWLNENVVDLEFTPRTVGDTPTMRVVPDLDVLRVINNVEVIEGDQVDIDVSMVDMTVTASGTIGIDSDVSVRNTRVSDPVAFTAAAFVEVLEDEGITVLGDSGEYPAGRETSSAGEPLAEWTSAPLSEFARVVQKISYNRGADLLACLIAVSEGSRDCVDGVTAVLSVAGDVGSSEAAIKLFDPAGSIDENRTSAQAHVDFLIGALDKTWGDTFVDLQPISGVDGSLTSLGEGTDAVGKIHAKTGTRILGYPTTQQLLYLARAYSGYITTVDDRELAFTVIFNSTTVDDIPGVFAINDRVADIVLALQEHG